MKYRPEIDGLRAVSVLSVVAFHSNIGPFSGGFVGVDIFFVISGYLITSLIAKGIADGTFSLLDFYVSRTVRIIPALLVMTFGTSVLGWVFLYPNEFDQLAKSAIWSSASASNIYFYLTADYFDSASTFKPLLNTWSLGLEEQFYLVYPCVLWLIWALWRKQLLLILVGVMLCSLTLSIYQSYFSPAAAYYLLPSRLWELVLGGLGALLPAYRILQQSAARYLPAAGLALIAAAVFGFDSNTKFPGLAATLPCGGCFILLVSMGQGAGATSFIARTLRLRPFVMVGQLSYSLYLWHWPLIVFQRIGPIVHTGLRPFFDKAIVMALLAIIAYLSWAFVEVPLRYGVFGLSRKRRAVGVLCGTAMICAASGLTLTQAGFPGRFNPAAINLASYLNYDPTIAYRTGTCFLTNRYPFSNFKPSSCLATTAGEKTYLLVGDSHAADLYAGLQAVLGGQHIKLQQATATGCKPVLRDVGTDTTCALMTQFVFGNYLLTHPVDLVIISARWADEDVGPLLATIRELKARNQAVAIIGPMPEYVQALPRLLAQNINSKNIDLQGYLYPGPRQLDRTLATMAEAEQVIYVSVYDKLCPNAECVSTIAGSPIYFDTSHLTKQASIFLAGKINELSALE